MLKKIAIIPFSLALLSGCAAFNERVVPTQFINAPSLWSAPLANENAPEFWLEEFHQPELRAYLSEAFNSNPSLQSQIAVVRLVRQQVAVVSADRWPQLSAGLGSSRNKRSNSSGFSISSEYSTSYNFSLDFSWEVDLWNRLGNGVKASVYDAEAAHADFEAARLSLAANIIKTWFDAIEAKQQLALSTNTVENYQSVLDIVERGYDYGLYRALDVRLARANMFNAKGRTQTYRIAKDQAVRSLEVLLGRYPSATLQLPTELPNIQHDVSAGIPATLLSRRPDVVAAVARFKAFDQRYIQAKKNRLPSIRLTGSGGTSAQDIKDLLNTDFLVWNFASGLVQPLFQGGRLDALRDEARLRLEQVENEYKKTVFQALQEVEVLLSSTKWLEDQALALAETAHESSEAELLASEDYVLGLTDINTLLQTQRQAFDAKSSLLAIKKSQLQNRVNLYLALGGEIVEEIITDEQ